MNVIRQCLKTLLTTCVPQRWLIVRGPRQRTDHQQLALTFDDGPHPIHTPPLLDCLERFGLRATFFVIGRQAEQHPDLIRRISAAGHEIANHTYSHSEPSQTSSAKFWEEVRRTDDLLEHLTGATTTVVRPPKGELNVAKFRALWRAGKTVALWNVDPKDFRMTRFDQMTEWCDAYQARHGDILLFHDNHPYAAYAVATLAERGLFEQFETTTLSDWLTHAQPRPRNESVPVRMAGRESLSVALPSTADTKVVCR